MIRSRVLLFRRPLVRPMVLVFFTWGQVRVVSTVRVSVRGPNLCDGGTCVRVRGVCKRCCFATRRSCGAIVSAHGKNVVATITMVPAVLVAVARNLFPASFGQPCRGMGSRTVAMAGAGLGRVKNPGSSGS